ncbi:putative peptide modification system cyclase [Dokdonella soli]|uniref:Peptide modification system cyclase n=1 Tax=Dokdonella soli TaxID=529810 RepID=A0ABN1IFB0_9GAMM
MTAVTPSEIEANTISATSVLRTLVLCDLVDSTALVERLGDQQAADLFRKHDRLARALVQQYGGKEIDKTDGFLLVFERPIQAVAFALTYQHELAALGTQQNAKLAARIGIHIGDIVVWDNAQDDVDRGAKRTEVEGLVKPVTARLMQLALPGQILLSGVAYDIAHRAQGELGEKLRRVRWRTHGRYRFKGVPDFVPVFEVGEEGVAPLKAPPWSGKAHRETPIWRRPLAVGIELVALVLLVAVPVFYLTRPAPAIAFANRDWVVVGDLKNLTGEKVFDDSLQTAFRVGLEQSRYVNVVPELQVRDALKRMERDPATTKVDRGIGSEIATREGARALILPTVAEIGGRVRITAEVIDPNTQTSVYSDSVDGSGEDSVLPAMDDLLKKMRGRLGESMASIGETSAPLAQATTTNLDALKAFSLGQQALDAAKGAEAMTLYSQAVALDPNFALAYLGLANVTYTIGQRAKAHEYALKATRNLDRLSARERLLAEGYASLFETPAKMREKWALVAKLYPDIMSGQQNLGYALWWFDNNLSGAMEQFHTVAESHHPRRGYSWLALADIQLAMGQVDNARSSFAHAREMGSPQLFLDPINLFLATNDQAGGAAALGKEDTHHFPFFEVEKQLRTAALEVSRGHFEAARTAAVEAQRIADQGKLAASQQRARLIQVASELGGGRRDAASDLDAYVADELRRAQSAISDFDYSSYTHLTLAAQLAMRSGQRALAERILAKIGPTIEASGFFNLGQPYHAAVCELEIERDAKKAVACLEGVRSERAYYQTSVALLRAYGATGESAKALATARWLVDHRSMAAAERLGEFASQAPNLIACDDALLTAAEQEAKAGKVDAARNLAGKLLQSWDADADGALLQRARQLAGDSGVKQKQE